MKRLLAVVFLMGCGGVTKSDLEACRDQGRNIAKAEGCQFLWSTCSESDDPKYDVGCQLSLKCPTVGYVVRPHNCVSR